MKKALEGRSGPAALFAAMVMIGTMAKAGDVWQVAAGAQSRDLADAALAFLPNELWIHAGDSIHWTFSANEIHTISFLKPGQVRPPLYAAFGVFIGCPGVIPDGSSFDGSACVSSAPSTIGQSYTVHFPTPGNFKLVCLVHTRMTGTIHVLNLSEILPHDQAFYDRQAGNERAELLSDAAGLRGRANSDAQQGAPHAVTAGIDAITGTGGGSMNVSVMRFLGATPVVHVGDTVEWTNPAPTVAHTITFGTEPADPMPPSAGVTMDPDGVRHAVISSPNENLNSGFLIAPNQETIGSPQWPVEITRFRVTFKVPGTFNYYCSLHDDLGMIGKVIVLP